MKAFLLVFGLIAFACGSNFFDSFIAVHNALTSRQQLPDGVCLPIQCVANGEVCLTPTDVPACAANCLLAFGTCVANADGNSCPCFEGAVTCLKQTNDPDCGFGAYYEYLLCKGNCPSNTACGTPPNPIPPLHSCNPFTGFCANGHCTAFLNPGTACTDDEQCGRLGSSCVNATGGAKCSTPPVQPMPGGEPCANAAGCISGICTSGHCVPKANGAACNMNEECAVSSYCDGTHCVATKTMGAACSDSQECGQFGYCNGTVCMPMFGGASGASCMNAGMCQLGLVCNAQGKCAAPPTIPANSPCQTDDNCRSQFGPASMCMCDNTAGMSRCVINVFPAACNAVFQTFSTCVLTNGCGLDDPTNINPTSCVRTKCADSASCALACFLNQESYLSQLSTGCLPFQPPTCNDPNIPKITTTATSAPGSTGSATSDASSVMFSLFTLALILLANF